MRRPTDHRAGGRGYDGCGGGFRLRGLKKKKTMTSGNGDGDESRGTRNKKKKKKAGNYILAPLLARYVCIV